SFTLATLAITSLTFMFDCVPEPVCQTTRGNCSSSLPSATSCATAAIASASFTSRLPRSRFTSAAARLTRPRAWMSGSGMRSLPMRKFSTERCVCAPHSLSDWMSMGPKESVSVRVVGTSAISFTYGRAPPAARLGPPLLLAESIETDDFGAAGRFVVGTFRRFARCGGRGSGGGGSGRRGRGRRQLLLARGFGGLSGRLAFGLRDLLELQPELHRRVEEALDRLERHAELLRHAAERKADRETGFVDLEIPELVLQDDGHLLGVLRLDPVGQAHALGAGVERDVEVVLAGQTLLRRVGQHVAHDAAQRLLGEKIVADVVGHVTSSGRRYRC